MTINIINMSVKLLYMSQNLHFLYVDCIDCWSQAPPCRTGRLSLQCPLGPGIKKIRHCATAGTHVLWPWVIEVQFNESMISSDIFRYLFRYAVNKPSINPAISIRADSTDTAGLVDTTQIPETWTTLDPGPWTLDQFSTYPMIKSPPF